METELKATRWLDLEHAAVYSDLPIKTLRRAIASGALAFSKPGRKFVLDVRDIDFWLMSLKRRLD